MGYKQQLAECLQENEYLRFEQGYIDALLFCASKENGDPLCYSGGGEISFSDADRKKWINRKGLELIRSKIVPFWSEWWEKICDCENYVAQLRGDDTQEEAAGRDTYYTSAGHGAGFWDGDWREPFAGEITEACRKLGELQLFKHKGRCYLERV